MKLNISNVIYDIFDRYEWPGNIRELQHAIERAVILSNNSILQPEDFNFTVNTTKDDSQLNLEQYNLEEVEKLKKK